MCETLEALSRNSDNIHYTDMNNPYVVVVVVVLTTSILLVTHSKLLNIFLMYVIVSDM